MSVIVVVLQIRTPNLLTINKMVEKSQNKMGVGMNRTRVKQKATDQIETAIIKSLPLIYWTKNTTLMHAKYYFTLVKLDDMIIVR